MIPSCAVCTIALPVSKQRRSLNPAASASNKTVVEYLATVSPELELANGSVCKACFSKLEKAATYLATAENITNELREKFALPPIRFVKLETVDRDRYRTPSPTSPELERETDSASIGRKRAHEQCDESLRKRPRFQSRKSLQFSRAAKNDQAQPSPLVEVGSY